MPSVSNLKIQRQTGSDSTFFATWDFNELQQETTSDLIQVGALVSIKPGSTWYNGNVIPEWAYAYNWYVWTVAGDKILLGENEPKTNTIKTHINASNLTIIVQGASESATYSEATLAGYSVKWEYDTGDNVWFLGGETETTEKYSLYDPPSNSLKIRITVKPISKSRTVNGVDTAYWTGTEQIEEHSVDIDPPEAPSTPNISIDKFQLTCKLENISDPRTDEIEYEIYSDTELYNTGITEVITRKSTYVITVAAGKNYRARARAINRIGETPFYSDWSDFTEQDISTIPISVENFNAKSDSKTSCLLTWDAVENAEEYEIEYTTDSKYFDSSDAIQTISGVRTTRYIVNGLSSGYVYFFRIHAVNNSGESEWSDVVTLLIGTKPASPSTWSSTTTAIAGETVTLFWSHNSRDGSSQKKVEISLKIDGADSIVEIDTEDEPDDEKTTFYDIPSEELANGAIIEWKVRTMGVSDEYGDWSIARRINVYAPPTLTMTVRDSSETIIDTITKYPFVVSGSSYPSSQTPIQYVLSIKSNSTYTNKDSRGVMTTVIKGSIVYEKTFYMANSYEVSVDASDVLLQNGANYDVVMDVVMNSGLNASATKTVNVAFSDSEIEPNATITIDKNNLSAYIMPFCKDANGNTIPDVVLSVYRVGYDGELLEIATNLINGENAVVVDPHPSLDYARYRIIARGLNGSTGYYDVPGYPINEKSIVIQWDEQWSAFGDYRGKIMSESPWRGSMVKLPYNIKVSERNSKSVTTVEYAGRRNLVSYYGTKIGDSGDWETAIPKYDRETIYQLRRLNSWLGDAYVREPSGVGYWASVSINFTQSYDDLTVPISISVNRVEGGV